MDYTGIIVSDINSMFEEGDYKGALKEYRRIVSMYGVDGQLEEKVTFIENLFDGDDAFAEEQYLHAAGYYYSAYNKVEKADIYEKINHTLEKQADIYKTTGEWAKAENLYFILSRRVPENEVYQKEQQEAEQKTQG
ncbi:hypothetical protein R9C00_28020 [Flammeovirgaceae bacterium SG7u.111]|nr:hypothetical protein [Flammeovirgaceae bacterium SG7u.132]WPO35548.1 hypothetical protein R9C00_28020 [Flammeovirgaceae bacterium SG7u.111]